MDILKKAKSWIKQKIGITDIQSELNKQAMSLVIFNNQLKKYQKEVDKYNCVDADVGLRGNNTIILTGVFRGRAYVQFYDVGNDEFRKLIDMLRNLENHCLIRNIDAPEQFKASFKL